MKSTMIAIGNFFFRWRNRVFPLIIIALFALAVPPQTLFASEQLEQFKDIVAVLIALSGLILRGTVIGYAYIKRGGLNKRVYADGLVTQGMFELCRNPLYVGNMLIYIGVFLMHGNLMVIALGITLFAFIYQCIIYAEETFLANKFGKQYAAYCADVPRWGITFGRFKTATQGMKFDFKKVIVKDYTTMATTIIMLALTESYEYLGTGNWQEHRPYLIGLGAVIVACGIWTLTVRYFKKRPEKTV